MTDTPTIRLATVDDLPAINDIYNEYVLHSTCTFQVHPATPAEREAWFALHDRKHPVTVLETDGHIVGWASLNRFHPREAWAATVEDSVYTHGDFIGQGLGRRLLADLLARATELGHHSMMAVIAADQSGSLRLHEKLGFEQVGRIREAGRKFNRWIDVVYMQKML